MKKHYFLGTLVSLLMLVALPVKAQVSSMVDLYGTYTFSAEMTVSEDGKQYESSFSNDCEVTIKKDESIIGWDALISGVAGATAMNMQVNGIDTEEHKFKIQNCFSNSYWGTYIYMSNLDGANPFFDSSVLGDMYFTYDPSTKTITIPDFTLVKMADYSLEKGTVLVTYKNAKLTLKEAENINVIDLSGDWHFKAGTGTYDKMADSELPDEFDMKITKTGDDNKNYNVAISYHTYATVEVPATFDGAALTLDLDSTLLDTEKGIVIRKYYGNVRSDVSFSVVSESVLSLPDYAAIAYYVPATEEVAAHYQTLQYFIGTAKKAGAVEEEKYDWSGTYTVKAGQVNILDGGIHPEEFTMTIEYVESTGAYYIKQFYGTDIYVLNQGATRLTVDPENSKEATLNTGILMKSIEPGAVYYKLFDGAAGTGPVKITVNEDGTITIGDFFIQQVDYNNDSALTPAAYYTLVTATKQAAEEPEELTWDGTYTVTADVEMLAEGECPKTFKMVVEYFSEWDMFLITTFMDSDISGANNGGIGFTPAESTATIKTGSTVKVVESGKHYWKMYDVDGGTNPLEVTRAEDGSLTIADFTLKTMLMDEEWNQTFSPLAKYTNVKAVKGTVDAIETVKAAKATVAANTYDLSGRLVKKATKGIFIKNGKKVIVK